MAAVTICSDFEPPKIKSDTVSPSIFHEVTIGSDFGAQKIKSDTVSTVSSWSSFSECWALSQLFHSPLSLSSRGFLVVSSAYLRLLIFLLAILILSCAFSSPAFLMMYSAYKLNKGDNIQQGDNIQPWRTPFPIWNQSVVPCPVLTFAFWPAYRFLRSQVGCSGIPISWRIFHSLLWSTQSMVLAQSIRQK